MAGVGGNIQKQTPKWMYWEVAIMVVHNMNNIVESIKLNQAAVEKWMLSQAIEKLPEMYAIMQGTRFPR